MRIGWWVVVAGCVEIQPDTNVVPGPEGPADLFDACGPTDMIEAYLSVAGGDGVQFSFEGNVASLRTARNLHLYDAATYGAGYAQSVLDPEVELSDWTDTTVNYAYTYTFDGVDYANHGTANVAESSDVQCYP